MKNCRNSVLMMCTCTLLWAALLSAESPDTLWTKIYGGTDLDVGLFIQETMDSGYIVTGSTRSFGAGNADLWILKTSENGDTLWTKSYGGAGDDEGRSIQQTSDSGYIIAGSTTSFGAGESDIWLLKIDANGDTAWTRTFGGNLIEHGLSVQQTYDSGYIVVGGTRSFSSGEDDVYVIKTDVDGGIIWFETYGGIGSDYASSVHETADSGYIVAGSTMSSGPGLSNVYLLKIDADGDTAWTRTYGQAGYLAVGFSVDQTTDGGYVIAGCITSGPGQTYGYIVRTDTAGNALWIEQYGGGGDYDWLMSIQQTKDGGYIAAGFTDSQGAGSLDAWLVRTDVDGDTVWTQTYGGVDDDAGYSVQQTSDDGYIITGVTDSFGAILGDVWIIRTEPDAPGIKEKEIITMKCWDSGPTIFAGPLFLPKDKTCRAFDITGRVVDPYGLRSGIYFIEVDGQIQKKVIKVR